MGLIPSYQGRSVAVLGLGQSGMSVIEALKNSGAFVMGWDDLENARLKADALGVPLYDLTQVDFSKVETLIISPGIPHTYPAPHPVVSAARAQGISPIGDVELFYKTSLKNPVVGITGTNGKSTTTALVTHLLQTSDVPCLMGGNIGVPLLSLPVLEGGIYVLELSSFQLDLTSSLDLDVAVLLNITPDHLERYAGFEGYIESKLRIFRNQSKPLKAVVGVDSALCKDLFKKLKDQYQGQSHCHFLPISCEESLAQGVSVVDGVLEDRSDPETPAFFWDLTSCDALKGKHNHQNAAASYAVLRLLGLSPEKIASGFQSFSGLAHRQEKVATLDGITYVNDSKATNAQATLTALQAYQESTIYIILGGRPKEGGLAPLQPYASHLAHAFLIGEAAQEFSVFCALTGIPFTISQTLPQALFDATERARAEKKSSPLVLLSPACASFDQFPHFEARGEAFKSWVQEYTYGQSLS